MSCTEHCSVCDELRAATLAIVGNEGIDVLTTDRLCHAVLLSPDEVRLHYMSAASCLYDTYDEIAWSIYQDFAAAFSSKLRWSDALRCAAHRLLTRMAERPSEARFCFIEVLRGDHELLRRRDASRRRLIGLFMREFARRHESPELFGMQFEMLIGASFQTIAASVLRGGPARLPELGPELDSRASVFAPVAA